MKMNLMRRISFLMIVLFVAAAVAAGCAAPTASSGAGNDQSASKDAGSSALPPEVSSADEPQSDESDRYGGTLTIGMTGEPSTLFYPVNFSAAICEIYNLVNEPVIAVDEDSNFQPGLLKEIPSIDNGGVSEDGKVITLKFKDNVKWEDGEPVTAHDYEFTRQVFINPENGCFNSSAWKGIESVELPDDYTAVVTLLEPDSYYIPYVLTKWLLPKHKMEGVTDLASSEYSRRPFSNGPFVLTEWVSGDHIILEKNPNYYQAPKPYLDKIVIKFFPDINTLVAQTKRGDIDLAWGFTGLQYPEIENISGMKVKTWASTTIDRMWMNMNDPDDLSKPHPVLGDKNVRWAIAHAINRQEMVDTLLNGIGKVAVTDFDNTPLFNPEVKEIEYNPDKAVELLEESGWKLGADGIREKDGIKCEVTFGVNTGNQLRENMQLAVQQYLQRVGIKMDIKNERTAEFFSTTGPVETRNFDLVQFSDAFFGPSLDVTVWYHSKEVRDPVLSPGTRNHTGLRNSELDALLEKQKATLDENERKEILFEVQKVVQEELPELHIYDQVEICTMKETVNNVIPSVYGRLVWNRQDWYVEK